MATGTIAPTAAPARLKAAGALHALALLALCSAYLQGSLTKLFDFGGAIAEMEHFGLAPPAPFAFGVIALEIGACVLVLSSFHRWLGALALALFTLAATLVALRFWEMPAGFERQMATNAFFEHLGLAGAFLLVALADLARGGTPHAPRPHAPRGDTR